MFNLSWIKIKEPLHVALYMAEVKKFPCLNYRNSMEIPRSLCGAVASIT